ncbi:MAG TPA: hypothetical protein VFE46_08220 [Pirellulales bacterium]|jgi:hypothetical protein|nr:hypothetical protein [Pirellulales bacterium]
MDDDELTTLIAANVTGEPDSAYDGIGKWIVLIAAGVCAAAAIAGFILRSIS